MITKRVYGVYVDHDGQKFDNLSCLLTYGFFVDYGFDEDKQEQ